MRPPRSRPWRDGGELGRHQDETPGRGIDEPKKRAAIAAERDRAVHRHGRHARGDRPRAAGERVIHMEVGQPGAPAPRPVLAAARQALADGRLGYTEALGLRRLRAASPRHYGESLRHRRVARPDRRHHRLVGRLQPRLPRRLRPRRPDRARRARLSGLPQHPRRARPRGRRHRDERRDAPRDDAGDARRGACRRRRSPASWWRARPIRAAR